MSKQIDADIRRRKRAFAKMAANARAEMAILSNHQIANGVKEFCDNVLGAPVQRDHGSAFWYDWLMEAARRLRKQ